MNKLSIVKASIWKLTDCIYTIITQSFRLKTVKKILSFYNLSGPINLSLLFTSGIITSINPILKEIGNPDLIKISILQELEKNPMDSINEDLNTEFKRHDAELTKYGDKWSNNKFPTFYTYNKFEAFAESLKGRDKEDFVKQHVGIHAAYLLHKVASARKANPYQRYGAVKVDDLTGWGRRSKSTIKVYSEKPKDDTRDHNKMSENNFWKIPVMSFKPERKPKINGLWQPKARNYILTLAAAKRKENKPKNYCVVGNQAARSLFMCENFAQVSPREVKSWLERANVYWTCMDIKNRAVPTQPLLSDYFPPREKNSLTFGSITITDENLVTLQYIMKRNKPYFSTIENYLCKGIDRPKAQQAMDILYTEYLNKKSILYKGTEIKNTQTVHRLTASHKLNPMENLALMNFFNTSGNTKIMNFLSLMEGRLIQLQAGSLTRDSDAFSTLTEDCNALSISHGYKSLYEFAIFLMALHEAASWKGVILSFLQYVRCLPKLLLDFVNENFLEELNIINLQGPGMIETCVGALVSLMTTVIATISLEFLPMLGEKFLLVAKGIAEGLVGGINLTNATIHKEMFAGLGKRIALNIMNGVISFIDRIKECFEAKSLLPLFRAHVSPTKWKFFATAMVVHRDVILIVPGQEISSELARLRDVAGVIPKEIVAGYTHEQYAEKIDELVKEGEEITKLVASTPLQADVRLVMSQLQALQAMNSTSFALSAKRIVPFTVYLFGKPGVGKTELTTQIFKSLGRRMDFPITDDSLYQWQVGVNFQDGYENHKWCVVMDDVDHKPIGTEPTNYVTDVVNLVNNKPFMIEQASIERKGKVAAKPLLLIYVTNFASPPIDQATHMKMAFHRRTPLKIKVEVKPQFRKSEENPILDVEKIKGVEHGDFYDFTVYTLNSLSDENKAFVKLERTFTKSELMIYLRYLFKKHVDEQRDLLSRQNKVEACDICGLDFINLKPICPCITAIVPQGRLNETVYVSGLISILGVTTFMMLRKLDLITYDIKDLVRGVKAKLDENTNVITEGVSNTVNYVRQARDSIVASRRDLYDIALTVMEFSERFKRIWSFMPSSQMVAALAMGALALYSFKSYIIPQGRVGNAVENFVPDGWYRAPQTFTPGLPLQKATYTREDLLQQLAGAYVQVKGKVGVWGIIVSHNLVLTVAHACEGVQKLALIHKGVEHFVILDETTGVKIGVDLFLIKCSSLSMSLGVVSKIWYCRDTQISQFDELVIATPVGDKLQVSSVSSAIIKPHTSCGCIVEAKDVVTIDGDCGSAYIARINTSWYIVAVHNARVEKVYSQIIGGNLAQGEVIVRTTLTSAAVKLCTTLQGIKIPLQQLSVTPDLQGFTHFPDKSEVNVAMSQYGVQVYPIGTATLSIHGSTMISKVHPLSYHEYFEDLATKWCGKRDYWVKPIFKGRMEIHEGVPKWNSPFVQSLLPIHRVPVNEMFMTLAMIDYLQPLLYINKEGYRPLSLDEAIVGVAGSIIQSVDLKTSTGPPFNTQKRHHIRIIDRQALISPDLYSNYIEFSTMVDSGDIPCPLAIGMLKDEQMSYKKAGELRTRVFNCLPVGFNLKSKQETAGVTQLMRNNLDFECMVGMNVTSLQTDTFIKQHLLRNGVMDRSRMEAGDFKHQDINLNGVRADGVAIIMTAMARAIGLDYMKVYTIMQATKHVIYCYKNDCFMVGGKVPSGGDKTVEENSIDNSQTQRYIFFRMKYGDTIPDHLIKMCIEFRQRFFEDGFIPVFSEFRDMCTLATYGDDYVKGVLPEATFYDPAKVSFIAKEIGATITNTDKSELLTFQDITEVEFLKRKFVYDQELQCWLPPISLKSIAKMLVLAKDSELTRVDHACEIYTNVLREMVYHGPELFSEVYNIMLQVIRDHDLAQNSHLRMRTYMELREEMASGSYSSYITTISQQGIGLKAVNDSQTVDLPQNTEVEQTEGISTVITTDPKTEDFGYAKWKPTMRMPDNSLEDYLTRLTSINRVTLLTTDAFNTIYSILPLPLFLADAYIANKVKGFRYLGGTIRVTVVVTVPPGCYGLYMLSADPMRESTVGTSYNATANQYPASQFEHVYYIDCAASNTYSFDLPFVSDVDYYSINSEVAGIDGCSQWRLKLFSMQPIAQANGTVVPTGYVETFVSMAPGYQLCMPIPQGKKFDEHRNDVNAKSKAMLGDKPSGIANKVAGVANSLSNVPVIGPMAKVAAMGASALGGVLDFFGFTRSADQQTPTTIIYRPCSNIANMDAVDTSEIAGLSNTNAISIDPMVVGDSNVDVGSFDYMCARWTLLGNVDWATTAAINDVLVSIPVTPFTGYNNLSSYTIMTVAGYLGWPFAQWRGDMEYLIVVPVSAFHRGKLQISWAPITGMTGDPTNVLPNAIVDVSVAAQFTCTIGYASSLPSLPTRYHNFPYTGLLVQGYNGVLQIRVKQPLVAPNATSATKIWVFARGKHMTYAVPKVHDNQVRTTDPESFSFNSGYVLAGKALGSEIEDSHKFYLAPTQKLDVTSFVFGENVRSARALMQKFSKDWLAMQNFGGGLTEMYAEHFPVGPVGNQRDQYYPVSAIATGYFTWFGWYARCFVGVAGSSRVKIFNGSNYSMPVGVEHYNKTNGIAITSNVCDQSTVDPMWVIAPNDAIEITVPYYYGRKYIRTTNPAYHPRSADASPIMRLYFPDPAVPVATPIGSIGIYRAGGPDLRLHVFRSTPYIATQVVTDIQSFTNIPPPAFSAEFQDIARPDTRLDDPSTHVSTHYETHDEALERLEIEKEEREDIEYVKTLKTISEEIGREENLLSVELELERHSAESPEVEKSVLAAAMQYLTSKKQKQTSE